MFIINLCLIMFRASLCPSSGEQSVKREKTNKMQQLDAYYQLLSQHVSGIIMPIFRRTKALLLHLVCCSGSAGCGWYRLWGAVL